MVQLTDRRAIFGLLAALMIADLASSLETAMLYVAVPAIAKDTGDMISVGWLLTGFALMQAVSAGLGGRLGDLFGRRRVLNILLSVCGIGSVICLFSSNFHWVIFGRVLQGVSGAILPLCFGLLKEHSPRKDVPFFVGLLAGVYAAAGAIGFMAGALFTQYGHWQQIFTMTSILPLVAVGAILLFVPRDARRHGEQKLDWLGGLLFAPAIALLLYALTESKTWGWTSPATWSVLAGGAVLGVVWAWWELRHPDPLINIRLLANRQIALGNAIYAATGLGAVQLVYVVFLLLQQPSASGVGLGVTAVVTAFLKLPGNGFSGGGAPLAGFLMKRGLAKPAAVMAGLILVVAWVPLYFFPSNIAVVVFTLCISSLGTGMVLSLGPNLILEVSPDERSSEVTGMATVFRAASIAIGAQVCTLLLTSSQVQLDGVSYPSIEGYQRTILFIIAACAAIAVLGLGLKSRPKSSGEATHAAELTPSVEP